MYFIPVMAKLIFQQIFNFFFFKAVVNSNVLSNCIFVKSRAWV